MTVAERLTEADGAWLERSLAGLPGAWSVLRHDDCDGGLMLVVVPEDDALATFVVDVTPAGIMLSALRDDALTACGCFAGLDALVVALHDAVVAETARDPRYRM